MEGKKYWIVEGRNFDTHWTTQTDRVSFKSDDLWKFMDAYHEHKLKLLGIANVVGRSEQLKAFLQEIENDKTYILNDYYKNKAERFRKSL